MSNHPDRRPGDPAAVDGSPSAATDPAPYAWLDDNARMAGAISPGVTAAYGLFFLATALVLVIVSFSSHHLGGLWIALGFGLIGGQVLRMGLARRAWRLRHPGVDPLSTVPSPTGGSAYGPDTRSASVGRWVIFVLCVLLGLLLVIALVDSFVATSTATSATVGSKVLLVLLAVLVLSVARYDLRRIRQLRSQRGPGPKDPEH
ncbi:phage holin family protein [Lapillicoccus sp.]|uniref:phage holin family protein n=1 Tax=Lapillicoccus sp. TaxID=1909287 RepID=UPI0025D8703C|nr:phage holin family protein [Lapillicoccus sp.]